MNRVRAWLFHLSRRYPRLPEGSAFTDVTDAFALMALLGKEVFSMMESISPLDLSSRTRPFLVQGPVFRIPCKISVLNEKLDHTALLVACARGYGQSMAEAILQAAEPWGLRPGGETVFSDWLKG
jgi:hypothetical protein